MLNPQKDRSLLLINTLVKMWFFTTILCTFPYNMPNKYALNENINSITLFLILI